MKHCICILIALAGAICLAGCDSEDDVTLDDGGSLPSGGETPSQNGGEDNLPDQQKPAGEELDGVDECRANDVKCDDAGSYVCGYFDSDPQTEWSDPIPCECGCGEDGQCKSPCDDAPSCTDACVAGARECSENGWRQCLIGSSGCLEWGTVTQCSGTQTCSGGQCVNTCTDACVAGARECSDDGWRQCAAGNSGCLEWGAVTPCSGTQTCSGGHCVDTCTDACAAGTRECSENGWRQCTKGVSGCLEWSSVTPCTAAQKCSDGACVDAPDAWVPPCTTTVCPTPVLSFPARITGNTASSVNAISTYDGCATTNESGPENYYVLKVDEPGTIVAGITEPPGGDVDIHLLSSLSPSSCLARSDKGIAQYVKAGIYYLSVDTYSSASNAGSYTLTVYFLADSGKCGVKPQEITRLNSPSVVSLPSTGKIVKEAHMVTEHDQKVNGSGWWPSTSTEGLAAHKAYTQQITGFSGSGTEAWCPAGEGGCLFGQGSTGRAVPDLAEAWYVCMYWAKASRPAAGTRYLVMNPSNGKAVVAAAGYEVGPGDGSRLGGAVEEVHSYCGTSHLGTLMFAELRNQMLEYGPIDCGE